MGAEYVELRQFRAKMLLALKKIQLVYPELKVEATLEALIVHPSTMVIPGTLPEIILLPEAERSAQNSELVAMSGQSAERPRRSRINPKALAAARRVMDQCGLSDTKLEPIIAAALVVATTSGKVSTLEQAAATAIANRREFVALGERLKYTVGPETFFSQGWCWDWELWPVDREELRRRQHASVGSY